MQRRVALFVFIQFALSAVSWVVRLMRFVAEHYGADLLRVAEVKQLAGHAAFTALFCGVWLWCRKGERSAGVLRAAEGAGTVTR